jgi:hypothetical protein
MHAKAIVGAAALAGFSMIQMSPAPVWAVVPAIAGVVAKTLQVVLDEISERDLPDGGFEIKGRIPSAKFDRRQQQSCFGPVKDGVPSNVVENCCGQMPGADITVTGSLGSGECSCFYNREGKVLTVSQVSRSTVCRPTVSPLLHGSTALVSFPTLAALTASSMPASPPRSTVLSRTLSSPRFKHHDDQI